MAEQAVIIRFTYQAADLDALYELEERLSEALEEAGVGECDGHDLAMDLSDAILYLYGPDAEALFDVARQYLEDADCVREAVATLRFGPPVDGVPERVVHLSQNPLTVRSVEPSDAEWIQAMVPEWWGRPLETDMLTRYFLTHFRETCLVADQNGEKVGFLIGFLSQTHADEAYIRLVVVHPGHRGEGVGRALYERFFTVALQHGRQVIRSVT